MDNLPLVTIAAINYNNSRTLAATLDSIQKQTYPNMELIVVDDCSTENDVALIEEWLAGYHGKYKLVLQPENKGVCATYNAALKHATGKYFTAIDTDDLMTPEKTAIQVAVLEQTGDEVGAIYTDAGIMDVHGNRQDELFIRKYRQFDTIPSGDIYRELLAGNFIPCMTVMVKKAVFDEIGGYDEQLVYEDYDMWLRIARAYQFIYLDAITAYYRIRPGSLTFTIKNWGLSDIRIYQKNLGPYLPFRKIYDIAGRAFFENDHEIMTLLQDLALKTGNRALLAAGFLGQSGCSFAVVKDGLERLASSQPGWDPGVFSSARMQLFSLYLAYCCPLLGPEINEALVRAMYEKEGLTALPRVREIAIASTRKSILRLYFEWLLHLPACLAEPQDVTANGLETLIKGQLTDSDPSLFARNILLPMSASQMRALGRHCIESRRNDLLAYLKAGYAVGRDRYLKTIVRLLENNIATPVAGIILQRIATYCDAGKSKTYIDLCILKDVFEARRHKHS